MSQHPTEDDKPTVAYDPRLSTSVLSNAAPAVIGDRFGRYQIKRELGRGAMGTVFLAGDTQLERDVAIKIPRFDLHHDPGIVQRFYREARVMATLHHPNLCSVYDVGQIDGVHYLTMAYIEGRRLSDVIADEPQLPQRRIATLVRKIAMALQAAHQAGVIHRDLKPSNIMIDRIDEPVIMDFGLARKDQSGDTQLTQIGELMGTPEYMSPERIEGTPDNVGPPSDVYSVGVILYEMLTGRLPFQGTMVYVIGKIVTSDPPPLSEVKPDVDLGLQAICLKAMARDPRDRFASAGELAAALDDYLEGRLAAPRVSNRLSSSRLSMPASSKPIDDSLNDPDRLIANFFNEDDGRRTDRRRRERIVDGLRSASPTAAWPATLEAACKCGARFAARVTLAGKTVKCPRCRGPLSVPETRIEVGCKCGQRFAAKQQLAGRSVHCPKCAAMIAVPPLP